MSRMLISARAMTKVQLNADQGGKVKQNEVVVEISDDDLEGVAAGSGLISNPGELRLSGPVANNSQITDAVTQM
jgi:hypothetical protein